MAKKVSVRQCKTTKTVEVLDLAVAKVGRARKKGPPGIREILGLKRRKNSNQF
jgi:hypothetical protein